MLDLAHHFGTERKKIGMKELQEVIDKDKVEIRKGDFVLLHTGWVKNCGRLLGIRAAGRLRSGLEPETRGPPIPEPKGTRVCFGQS